MNEKKNRFSASKTLGVGLGAGSAAYLASNAAHMPAVVKKFNRFSERAVKKGMTNDTFGLNMKRYLKKATPTFKKILKRSGKIGATAGVLGAGAYATSKLLSQKV